MAQPIKTALIVDDSRLARVALSKLLANRGIQVDMVGCGEDGLEHLRQHQPDVVFMDYMMPDMDGFEASRRVFADPQCHKPPIVMYTSQDTEEDRIKAAEIGISGFLGKPTTLGALDDVLQSIAAGQPRPVATPQPAPVAPTPAPAASPAPAVQPATAVPAQLETPQQAARAAARDMTEQLALRYFEQLRDEVQAALHQAQQNMAAAETAAERRALAAVEAAIAQLPPPERIDVAELEARLRSAAEESAETVAGSVARSAAAAAARAQGPQLLAEARQAALDAVELADLHGRLQSLVQQEAMPRLRQELQSSLQQDLHQTLAADLEARIDHLESRLLEAAEHAASAELRAASGGLLLKAVTAGVIAGALAAGLTSLLL